MALIKALKIIQDNLGVTIMEKFQNLDKMNGSLLNKVKGGFDIEKNLWNGYGYQLGWRSKWNLNHRYFKI